MDENERDSIRAVVYTAIESKVHLHEQHGFVWLRGISEAADAVMEELQKNGVYPRVFKEEKE